MKKGAADSLKTILLICLLIFLEKQVAWLPWWGFIVPVAGLGIMIRLKKWQVMTFPVGLMTGFLIWSLCWLYYDKVDMAHMLQRLALLLSVHWSIVLLLIGFIGGLLTGLSLYLGSNLFIKDRTTEEITN